MKSNLLYILFLFVPLMGFAQKEPRQVLSGRVIADSLQVENISVMNLSSNVGAVTDNMGNFTIYARAADTLLFSSITFHTTKMVLKREDLLEPKLFIKLYLQVTVLDEIVIMPRVLTGNLNEDSRKKKIATIGSSFNSAAIATGYLREHKYAEDINQAMGPVEKEMMGLNFVNLYKFFVKPKKKDKAKEALMYNGGKTFAEIAKERFTYHFFTQTLKIPKDEIGLFLTFCDSGSRTLLLLDPSKEFELTDYLITMSAEYLKKDK